MTRDEAITIKPGRIVRPLPLWNRSERSKDRKLDLMTEVLDVRIDRGCQTGVMFKVRFQGGGTTYLDAGWFETTNLSR